MLYWYFASYTKHIEYKRSIMHNFIIVSMADILYNMTKGISV